MKHDFYPANPSTTARATLAWAYRRRVLGLLASLVLAGGLYVALVVVSGWLLVKTVEVGPPSGRAAIFWLCLVIAEAFFVVFLVKALFRRTRPSREGWVRLSKQDHPRFFGFLKRLAKDTGAPFPRRVFVTDEINASIAFDSSFLNLVLPARRSLVIGLGLVNALTLDELKAVLAHELGHYSQRSARLGTHVGLASRVMGSVVFDRDRWDQTVANWCRLPRVGFVAWGLVGAVVGVRRVFAFVIHRVMAAHLSLSRELEFHADSVACQVTGSDSLPRALKKLGYAEQAEALARGVLGHASDLGFHSEDVFEHQRVAWNHLAARDPSFGHLPELPDDGSAPSSPFDDEGDIPPTMWSTHPSNRDRERALQRRYVRSVIDSRPAWELFDNPSAVRRQVSQTLAPAGAKLTPASEIAMIVDRELKELSAGPRWRNIYDRRRMSAKALEEAQLRRDLSTSATDFEELIDQELVEESARWRALGLELTVLARAASSGAEAVTLRGQRFERERFQEVHAELHEDHSMVSAWLKDRDAEILVAHRAHAQALSPESELRLQQAIRLQSRVMHVAQMVQSARDDVVAVFRGQAPGETLVSAETQLRRAVGTAHGIELTSIPAWAGAEDLGSVLEPLEARAFPANFEDCLARVRYVEQRGFFALLGSLDAVAEQEPPRLPET